MIFSFWKLVILAAIGYWLWRSLSLPKPAARRPAAAAKSTEDVTGTAPRSVAATDLEKCPKCDSYVTLGKGGGCARADCPIR